MIYFFFCGEKKNWQYYLHDNVQITWMSSAYLLSCFKCLKELNNFTDVIYFDNGEQRIVCMINYL